MRWFDQWLKGRDTGIMEEPRLAVYVREWHPPGPYLEDAPGTVALRGGLADRADPRSACSIRGRTARSSQGAPAAAAAELRYVPTTGVEAGGPVMWCGDVAPDQRPTDAFSLVYETPPLEEDVEILGLPKALLQVSADAPHADWFARLNDVAPDGTVTLVAGAGQNGAHRESAREPKAIEPGKPFPLEIELHFTSWVFPKGHRIRFAVSNAQWPMIWPTPYPMTTTLFMGASATRASSCPSCRRPSGRRPQLPAARPARGRGCRASRRSTPARPRATARSRRSTAIRARARRRSSRRRTSATRFPWGEEHNNESITHEAEDGRPEKTVGARASTATEVKLPDRTLRWESVVTFRSDRENFYYSGARKLKKDGIARAREELGADDPAGLPVRRGLGLGAFFLVATAGSAAPPEVTAIRFGRLVDGRGGVVPDAVVVVESERITSVGSGNGAVPRARR